MGQRCIGRVKEVMDALFHSGAPRWRAVSEFAHAVWSCDIDPRAVPPTSAALLFSSAVAWVAESFAYATGQHVAPPPVHAPPPSAAEAVIIRQAALLGIASASIRNQLPLDSTNDAIILMPQLLGSWGPDLEHFAVALATSGGAQKANVIVGSASSGVGKTHLAYAWGVSRGSSVVARAITSSEVPMTAPPFRWLLAQLEPLVKVPAGDAIAVSEAAFLFVRLTLLSFTD